jgi:uncharacterized protein with HEPN domain
MNERDRVRLLHMCDAAALAIRLCAPDPRRSVREDAAVRFAALKLIEIVGEASKSVSTEARESLPATLWAHLARTRDRLVHGYFDIDLRVISGIVTDQLPPLVAALDAALGDSTGESSRER